MWIGITPCLPISLSQALNGEYLDLATEALAANVTWKVDGVPLKPDAKLDGCDFNGDGQLDASDGQALLEYATGLRSPSPAWTGPTGTATAR